MRNDFQRLKIRADFESTQPAMRRDAGDERQHRLEVRPDGMSWDNEGRGAT
jgi:hypothetical protein